MVIGTIVCSPEKGGREGSDYENFGETLEKESVREREREREAVILRGRGEGLGGQGAQPSRAQIQWDMTWKWVPSDNP